MTESLQRALANRATAIACELGNCEPGPIAVALVWQLHEVKAALLEIETSELLSKYGGANGTNATR